MESLILTSMGLKEGLSKSKYRVHLLTDSQALLVKDGKLPWLVMVQRYHQTTLQLSFQLPLDPSVKNRYLNLNDPISPFRHCSGSYRFCCSLPEQYPDRNGVSKIRFLPGQK